MKNLSKKELKDAMLDISASILEVEVTKKSKISLSHVKFRLKNLKNYKQNF